MFSSLTVYKKKNSSIDWDFVIWSLVVFFLWVSKNAMLFDTINQEP